MLPGVTVVLWGPIVQLQRYFYLARDFTGANPCLGDLISYQQSNTSQSMKGKAPGRDAVRMLGRRNASGDPTCPYRGGGVWPTLSREPSTENSDRLSSLESMEPPGGHIWVGSIPQHPVRRSTPPGDGYLPLSRELPEQSGRHYWLHNSRQDAVRTCRKRGTEE